MSKQGIYQPWNIRKIFCPDCTSGYRVVKLSMSRKDMQRPAGFSVVTPDLVEYVEFSDGKRETKFSATRKGKLYVLETEPTLTGVWNKNGRDYEEIESIVSLIISAPFIFVADRNTSKELEQGIAEYYQTSRERKERHEARDRAKAS